MRIKALIIRIYQQMVRDKRTLGLLFLAPLLILTLMYFMFNSNTVEPKLGVVNIPATITEALERNETTITTYTQVTRDTVIEDQLDGLLEIKDGDLIVTLVNSDPNKSKALLMKLNQSLASHSATAPIQVMEMHINYIYGDSETTFFDVLSPILVGYFVFFFVFLISGIGLLRERTTGTLERLMSTPVKRIEVVFGYLVGYGLFAVVQTVIVVLFSVHVLNITLVGSMGSVILINLVLAIVALSLGILLSTFAASEFQMMQFIPIVIIPQIFFAGIFPIEGMAKWLQIIGRAMPIYYAADALKGVMYKGLTLSEVSGDLIALTVFAVVFIVLNIVALKKYRVL